MHPVLGLPSRAMMFPPIAHLAPIVVVVEDDALIRETVVELLADAGFSVIAAAHADDALAILDAQAGGIQVLFTDVHMPGSMDGLELAHHAHSRWPWISVLVASARARLDVTELPDGSRFLSKPYYLSGIIANIQEMIAAG